MDCHQNAISAFHAFLLKMVSNALFITWRNKQNRFKGTQIRLFPIKNEKTCFRHEIDIFHSYRINKYISTHVCDCEDMYYIFPNA